MLGEMSPCVMAQTPAVLSIGRRRMVHGYSIHWPSSKSPYFLKPNGEKITCDAHAYVPYVRHRDPAWKEKSAAVPATAELSGMMAERHTRFADTLVAAGGGNALAAPGAAESLPTDASPEEEPSGDGAVEASPDEDPKRIPNTPAEAKSLGHLLTHLPKNEHCAACARR